MKQAELEAIIEKLSRDYDSINVQDMCTFTTDNLLIAEERRVVPIGKFKGPGIFLSFTGDDFKGCETG